MIHVTLRIYSDDLAPDTITARLGVQPTRSFANGEPIITNRGRYSNHRTTGWLLSSRDVVHSTDLDNHLKWLLDRTEGAVEPLRALLAETHDVSIVCALSVDAGHGPTISPDTLARLARLNLPLDFELYV